MQNKKHQQIAHVFIFLHEIAQSARQNIWLSAILHRTEVHKTQISVYLTTAKTYHIMMEQHMERETLYHSVGK